MARSWKIIHDHGFFDALLLLSWKITDGLDLSDLTSRSIGMVFVWKKTFFTHFNFILIIFTEKSQITLDSSFKLFIQTKTRISCFIDVLLEMTHSKGTLMSDPNQTTKWIRCQSRRFIGSTTTLQSCIYTVKYALACRTILKIALHPQVKQIVFRSYIFGILV